jgi:hypothetical protein
MRKDNQFRIKIDFEDEPIINHEVKGIDGLKSVFSDLKKKFR